MQSVVNFHLTFLCDSLSELPGSRESTDIPGLDLMLLQHGVHASLDLLGVRFLADMLEHLGGAEEHGSGVGNVLAHALVKRVLRSRLENGDLSRVGGSGDKSGTADQSGGQVVNDVTVQVGHDHDVKLLRVGDQLHGGVVHNHLLKLNSGVELCNLLAGAHEETVAQLHDVGLVNAGHLLAAVAGGVVEGELGNAAGLFASNDLQI
jgi:hypothetical protein